MLSMKTVEALIQCTCRSLRLQGDVLHESPYFPPLLHGGHNDLRAFGQGAVRRALNRHTDIHEQYFRQRSVEQHLLPPSCGERPYRLASFGHVTDETLRAFTALRGTRLLA